MAFPWQADGGLIVCAGWVGPVHDCPLEKYSLNMHNQHSSVFRGLILWFILLNSVVSDHGCTSSIYFDNACDNVTLRLYNVTLTSQKPYQHNNKCDCSKTNGLNEVYVFFSIKIAIAIFY